MPPARAKREDVTDRELSSDRPELARLVTQRAEARPGEAESAEQPADERRGAESMVSPGRVKLVWFVPADALDATRAAVFAAGAGYIGDYGHCSWYTPGTGTFLGGEGTDPAVGEAGREERVSELRVETVVAAGMIDAAVAALVAAHPYEEPAYDVYPLLEA